MMPLTPNRRRPTLALLLGLLAASCTSTRSIQGPITGTELAAINGELKGGEVKLGLAKTSKKGIEDAPWR